MQSQNTDASFRLPAVETDADEREDTIVITEDGEFPQIHPEEDGPVLPWDKKQK